MKKKGPKKILLQDLELSTRTFDLLNNLKISTLDELLKIPEISCTRLSKIELQAVFEDYNVCYNGVFNIPESKVKITNTNGGVKENWNIIKNWLVKHHPSLLLGFSDPAMEDQIKKVESELDCTLPNDYQEFVCIHNGQKNNCEPMVWTCSLVNIEQIPTLKKEILEAFDNPNESISYYVGNSAIKPIVWSNHWIPIGISARARDILCLDLDPTELGNSGQVILTACDSDNHLLLAASFKEFLSLYFEQLQTGEIEIK